jgi:hypothetical protein
MNRRELLAIGAKLREDYEKTRNAPLTPALLCLLVKLRETDPNPILPKIPANTTASRPTRRRRDVQASRQWRKP